MNEQIKELAFMAANGMLSYDGEGEWLLSQKEAEKFAEFIVKKCLEQCYCRGMNDELYAGQLKAAAYIEEYFGVEA